MEIFSKELIQKYGLRKLIDDYLSNHWYHSNKGIAIDYYEAVNIIIELSKQLCELQKQECADNAKAFIAEEFRNTKYIEVAVISKGSILNCKNVCDE